MIDMFYYILVTSISFAVVLTSYFAPQALSAFGSELNHKFANIGITLLWITLLVKPVFMILMKYTELKTLSFSGLREHFKTIKGRSIKSLGIFVLSCIYFLSGIGMKWRRLFGITTFLAICTHAGLWITQWMHSGVFLLSQLQNFWLLSGYVGLVMLFIGYVTSNNFSLRFFKGNWKTIQYSSYIALLFAILHLLFLNFGEYYGQLVLLAIYIFLKLIEKKKIHIQI